MSLWGQRVMPLVYDPFLWLGERRGLQELRRRTAGRATGRVLEIGCGTGLNLPHYGERVEHLTATEPEEGMARTAERRLFQSPVPSALLRTGAEDLPFQSGSFDSVVGTLVLCTVPDAERALREVHRVLVPGGRLLFLEHVRAHPGTALERWQDRLFSPWRAFAYGCRCNQDTLALIEAAGFAVEDVSAERWRGMPPIVQPLVMGCAVASPSRPLGSAEASSGQSQGLASSSAS